MTRKRRSPHHRPTQRSPHHSRPQRREFSPETQPLIQLLRDSLRSDDPVPFLVNGALIARVCLEPPVDLPEGDVSLLDSFLEVDIAETTAILHLVSALAEDELTRARVDRVLAVRRQPMPATVSGIADARIAQAWFMGDELGDGDNVILGVEWPSGESVTAVAFIDHNLGTIAKDAFFIGARPADVVDKYTELTQTAMSSVPPVPLDLASARTRIEQAIANLLASEYVPEDDDPEMPSQWPQCQELLEYLLRTLPSGGAGYDVGHDCDPEVIAETVEAFMRSPEAQELGGEPADVRALAEWLVHFANHTGGDPLRWSPVSVEICMVQELPFALDLSDGQLDLVPDVLPALIRYSHREASISASARAETLAAIPHWLPDFRQLRTVVGPARASYREVQDLINGSPRDRAEHAARRAAGPDPFDLEPLPDELLMLDAVPADLHPVLTEISGHLDRLTSSGELPGLGAEFRTACRRFLSRAAANDPAVLRRRAKTLNTAATVAWVVGRANELVGSPRASVRSTDLQSWFGVSSLSSDRGDALVRAFRGPDAPPSLRIGIALGSADVLVSGFRARLLREIETAAAE